MSGEDDTFDIDIYGDEADQTQEEYEQQNQQQQDSNTGYEGHHDSVESTEQANHHDTQTQDYHGEIATTEDMKTEGLPQPTSAPQQGIKRKAEEDIDAEDQSQNNRRPSSVAGNRAIDPGAQPAIKLSELHWWTTEDDLRGFCAAAGTESELRDISFGEHKINGKSRGEAYMEFTTPSAASATKHEIEAANAVSAAKEPGSGTRDKFVVWYMPVGNPFRGRDGGQGDKKFGGAAGKFNTQGGAYNSSFANRGNFGGRGNFNRGGGFNNGMGRGAAAAGGQYGMNAGAGNFQNPMMAGFNNMGGYGGMGNMANMGNMGGMGAMGGYGSMMGGGSMMGNMMGRGGYGGINGMGGMGGMNAMGNMGNMMGAGGVMGRGGWGGGMGTNGMGGNMGGAGMQGGNKKPRMG